MNSIGIGWKKQASGKMRMLNKKSHSQKPPARKVAPSKRADTTQITKPYPYVPQTVRSDKILVEDPPYTPLPINKFVPKSANSSATEIQVYDDKRLCSARAAVATFIIIIVLILVAGFSVGIVFAVTASKNSAASGNNNQSSFTTISSGSLTSSIVIGSQTGPPCSAYTQIDDPTRNINQTGSYSACDNGPLFNTSNGGVWVRFVGTGGTIIPLSAPDVNRCGGFLSTWYNNTLPTTVNVTTSGMVCIQIYASDCGVVMDVSVVYCPNNYYVYFLPPMYVCNTRYCTV